MNENNVTFYNYTCTIFHHVYLNPKWSIQVDAVFFYIRLELRCFFIRIQAKIYVIMNFTTSK